MDLMTEKNPMGSSHNWCSGP